MYVDIVMSNVFNFNNFFFYFFLFSACQALMQDRFSYNACPLLIYAGRIFLQCVPLLCRKDFPTVRAMLFCRNFYCYFFYKTNNRDIFSPKVTNTITHNVTYFQTNLSTYNINIA